MRADMSSQDKVERVLKEIHLAFSRSESCEDSPDKIIVDRKYFLELLDRLNHSIYDMMEEYEHTRQSRENAERALRRKGEQIISSASSQAEDVYASSILYTADMIGRIRDLMDRTNDSMNDLFREFRRGMKAQRDLLQKHETELEGQLSDLADTRTYLSILEEIRQEERRRMREEEANMEPVQRRAGGGIYTPPSAADVRVNEQFFERTGTELPGQEPAPAAAETPDIRVNTDAAYFKWRETRDRGGEKTAPLPETAGENVQKQSGDGRSRGEEDGGEPAGRARKQSGSHGSSAEAAERGQTHIRSQGFSADAGREAAERGQTNVDSRGFSADVGREAAGRERAQGIFDGSSADPGGNAAEAAWAESSSDFAKNGFRDPDGKAAEDEPEKAGGSPEFPDEEAIMRAVLEDEREEQRKEDEQNGSARGGSLLKRIFFGR